MFASRQCCMLFRSTGLEQSRSSHALVTCIVFLCNVLACGYRCFPSREREIVLRILCIFPIWFCCRPCTVLLVLFYGTAVKCTPLLLSPAPSTTLGTGIQARFLLPIVWVHPDTYLWYSGKQSITYSAMTQLQGAAGRRTATPPSPAPPRPLSPALSPRPRSDACPWHELCFSNVL